MEKANKKEGGVPRFTIEVHGVEKELRCSLGRFPVQKTACCPKFTPKEV